MFEQAADLSPSEIKAYRNFAFTDTLSNPGNDPFFSVDNAAFWISSLGYQLYLLHDDSVISSTRWGPEDASTKQLIAYRTYILADQYVGHPFFSLENPDIWINPIAFQAYMDSTQDPVLSSTPATSRAPSRATSSISMAESHASSRVSFIPSSRASSPVSYASSDMLSRPSSSMSVEVIEIHDSDSDDPGSTAFPAARSTASSGNPFVPKVEIVDASISLSSLPPATVPDTKPERKKKGKGKGKLQQPQQTAITRQEKVDHIVHSTSVPTTYDVPRTPTALLVDLSGSVELLRAPEGHLVPLDTFIRAQNHESWDGGAGHTVGDVNVAGFTSNLSEKIRCRRCHLKCNGIDTCEFFEEEIFDGLERYEADEKGMQELWDRALDQNEEEAASGIICRFPNQGGTRVSSASALCAPLPHVSPLVLNVAVVDPTTLKVAVAAHDLVISLIPPRSRQDAGRRTSPRCMSSDGAARAAGIVVLNEARLDPGIDHLSAVKIIDGLHAKGSRVKDFRLQCGALPTPDCTDNPLAERRRHARRWCRTHGERAAASLPVPGDILGRDRALEQREDSDALRSFLECMCSRGRWKGSLWSLRMRLQTPSAHGKRFFIGCSDWKRSEQGKHLYWPMPWNIDEAVMQFVLDNDGHLPNGPQSLNETCFLTAHPRIGLNNCSYSHIIDGQIRVPEIRRRKCKSEMIIFIPVKPSPATLHKAIVILRNPHNHPMHPKTKPSAEDNVKLGTAVKSAGLTGLTVQKLRNGQFLRPPHCRFTMENRSQKAVLHMPTVDGFEISSPRRRRSSIRWGWDGKVKHTSFSVSDARARAKVGVGRSRSGEGEGEGESESESEGGQRVGRSSGGGGGESKSEGSDEGSGGASVGSVVALRLQWARPRAGAGASASAGVGFSTLVAAGKAEGEGGSLPARARARARARESARGKGESESEGQGQEREGEWGSVAAGLLQRVRRRGWESALAGRLQRARARAACRLVAAGEGEGGARLQRCEGEALQVYLRGTSQPLPTRSSPQMRKPPRHRRTLHGAHVGGAHSSEVVPVAGGRRRALMSDVAPEVLFAL
ncbi:hypothetical protein B0H14DRAFT_3713516 [Mycena olivaceomarginata]|nr:hypothetical protein B0H14DRAFT_3713516 [Mycena olivaceomarginata]